jgi:SAM-dependent methyltransferase
MARGDGLSVRTSEERYAAERRQAVEIAAGREDAWGWSSPAGKLRAARRAEFLIEAAHLEHGVECLEAGAGTGEFTQRLLAAGCNLTAVELSETTAAICAERVGGRAEVVVGNIETGEGLSGRSFDAVVGVSVLHHVNLEQCLDTAFGLLRSGGRFAFSEPNMANPQVWAERHIGAIRRLRHVTPHETAFHPGELKAAFENAGFVVEICEPFEFLHPATARVLIDPVRRIERTLEQTAFRRIGGSIRVAGHKP